MSLSDATSGFVDRTSMYLHYDKVYTTHAKRPSLKVLILFTDLKVEELPQILSIREKAFRSYSTTVKPLGQTLYKVFLQRTMGLERIKKEIIVDTGSEGFWVILTDADSYFVTHVLETFFDKLYPMISRLYFNYSQMRLLLKAIQNSCQVRTTMTHYAIRRIKTKLDGDEDTREIEETQILWGEDVDEDIKRLLSDRFIVKVNRLDFSLIDQDKNILLKAQINRKGLTNLKFGSFTSFYQNVVFTAMEFGHSQKVFYDHRERSFDKNTINLRPLQINYSQRIGSEQIARFTRKITDAYSCSIIHGGNPYFVGDLCDYEGGSSFGVAILGSSVTVTPVTRATPSGVWKLLDEIQEIIGDGEIVEVKMR